MLQIFFTLYGMDATPPVVSYNSQAGVQVRSPDEILSSLLSKKVMIKLDSGTLRNVELLGHDNNSIIVKRELNSKFTSELHQVITINRSRVIAIWEPLKNLVELEEKLDQLRQEDNSIIVISNNNDDPHQKEALDKKREELSRAIKDLSKFLSFIDN